jgi:hypothetical protein
MEFVREIWTQRNDFPFQIVESEFSPRISPASGGLREREREK